MAKSKTSKRWLQEHFADQFVQKSHEQGLRSRAAYKLLAMQEKDDFIQQGAIVVDLGAAPGSWSQVVRKVLDGQGRIIAVDILPMQPIDGVEFVQGDFTCEKVLAEVLAKLDKQKVDLVLSDMAPNLSGIKSVDQAKSMYLAELALDFALQVLAADGVLLVKLFQGEGFAEFVAVLRQKFASVKIRKPQASKSHSREVYLLARNMRLDSSR